MDVGVEITRTVEVLVNSSAPGTLENRAQVGSGDTDTNTANNLAVLTTNVTTSADLVLSVLESSDPLIAGGLITYTASITNSGPSDASNVIFLNENQSGLSFVTAPVLCNHHGRFLDCALGVIPANNRVDVLLPCARLAPRWQLVLLRQCAVPSRSRKRTKFLPSILAFTGLSVTFSLHSAMYQTFVISIAILPVGQFPELPVVRLVSGASTSPFPGR